ncbi:MAG: preprotein translocase subunit YajC [Nostocoides sp.]
MNDGNSLGLLLLALPLLLLVFMMFSQRKRQRAVEELQTSLAVGEQVMTTSGLHGTVASLEDGVVYLEVAPGVVLRFDRRAIGAKVS